MKMVSYYGIIIILPDSLFFDDIGYKIYIDTDGYVITGLVYKTKCGWPPTGASDIMLNQYKRKYSLENDIWKRNILLAYQQSH